MVHRLLVDVLGRLELSGAGLNVVGEAREGLTEREDLVVDVLAGVLCLSAYATFS